MKTQHIFSALAVMVILAGCKSPQFRSSLSEKLKLKNSPPDTKLVDAKAADAKQSLDSKAMGPDADRRNVEFVGYDSEIGSPGGNQHDSKWINDHLMRGHREVDAGRFKEAQHYYRQVLERDPLNAAAHHRMAIINDEMKNFHAADYHYQRAIAANPNDPNVLSDLGWSYILQGKYHDADEILLSALVYDRVHRKSLDRLGYLYFQQGDEERAKEMLSRGCSPIEAQQKIASLLTQQRPAPHGRSSVQLATGSPVRSNENQWMQDSSSGRVEQAAATRFAPTSEIGADAGARPWPQTQSMEPSFADGNAGTTQPHQPQIRQATQGRYAGYHGPTIAPAGHDLSGADTRLSARPPHYAPELTGGNYQAGQVANCPQRQCQIPGAVANGQAGPARLPTVNSNPLDSMPYFPTVASGSSVNAAGQRGAAASAPNVTPIGAQSPQTTWPASSAGVQPAGYENRAPVDWPHAPSSRAPANSQHSTAGQSLPFRQYQPPADLQGRRYAPTNAEHQAAIVGMNAGTSRAAFPVIDGNATESASMSGDMPWPGRHPLATQSNFANSRTAEIPRSHQFSGLGTAGPWPNDHSTAENYYSNPSSRPAVPQTYPHQQGRALNGSNAPPQIRPRGAAAFPGTSQQQWPIDSRTNPQQPNVSPHNWQQPQADSAGAGTWPPPANNYPQYNPMQRSEWQQPAPYSHGQSGGVSPNQGW